MHGNRHHKHKGAFPHDSKSSRKPQPQRPLVGAMIVAGFRVRGGRCLRQGRLERSLLPGDACSLRGEDPTPMTEPQQTTSAAAIQTGSLIFAAQGGTVEESGERRAR